MVLGCVCGEHAAYSRVEAASENGGQAGFLEAFAIGPLPAVFEMSFVFRLIVGRVEIIDPAFQTCVHDREVLIGEGYVDDKHGLVAVEQFHKLRNAVSIHTVGVDLGSLWHGFAYGIGYGVAFAFCT